MHMKLPFQRTMITQQSVQMCNLIIKQYQQDHKKVSSDRLIDFSCQIDRNTIRLTQNFGAFQQLLLKQHEKLIDNPKVKQPLIAWHVSNLFKHLNYHSKLWIQRMQQLNSTWRKSNTFVKHMEASGLYQYMVDIGPAHSQLKNDLFKRVYRGLQNQIKYIGTQTDQMKIVNNISKSFKTILLDPDVDTHMIEQLLNKMSKQTQNFNFEIESRFDYAQSAVAYELMLTRGVKCIDSKFLSFLKEAYSNYQAKKQSKYSFESSIHDQDSLDAFKRKGESVFQNRFQRHLQTLGYQFKRNCVIGVREYDLLIEGKFRQSYKPFQNIDFQRYFQGNHPTITEQEMKMFDSSPSLWNIQLSKPFKQQIVVNLNGPYHQLFGDERGLTRSQTIKSDILRHYGYKRYVKVNHKEWQDNTTDIEGTHSYIERLLED